MEEGTTITKGNFTESSILKFLLANYSTELEKIKKQKFKVLHWKQFSSNRKRTTLVIQLIDEYNKPGEVQVITKGSKTTVMRICSNVFQKDGVTPLTEELEE